VAVTRAPAAVALVGFMGAGKSVVGRELAAALGIPFVDTDDLIVARAGPIDAVFSARGEAAFRALEAEIVTAAAAEVLVRPCVLALGGGAVLNDEVRTALARLPHVVWLAAPAGVLWERVRATDEAERPLATDEASFAALLAGREPLYREVATQIVDVEARRPRDIAAEIVAALSGTAGDARDRAEGGSG
jgi:shikimate kinase